jgi:hypothetical protein
MDQLSEYINRAVQAGQSENRIRNDLLIAGWQTDQVDSALAARLSKYRSSSGVLSSLVQDNPLIDDKPNPYQLPPVQNPSALNFNRRNKLGTKIIVSFSLLILVFVSGTSYQSVAQQFIIAMQQKNKKLADSLESPSAKVYLLKNEGNSSFYSSCTSSGNYCSKFFTKVNLAHATMTVQNYTLAGNQQGKQLTYTEKQASISQTSKGCQGSSSYILVIDELPQGSSWQINNVSINLSGSTGLCPA